MDRPLPLVGVDHVDLLDDRMLQLSDLRRDDGFHSRHIWIIVEDGLLLEVLHLWGDFRDGALRELDGPEQLNDVGSGWLAGCTVDES